VATPGTQVLATVTFTLASSEKSISKMVTWSFTFILLSLLIAHLALKKFLDEIFLA
jgi:hypothetical protein